MSDKTVIVIHDDNAPITFEWLRSVGFKLDHHTCDNQPHMSRELDCSIETKIELSRTRKGNDEWFCWFRDDVAHTKARFVHLRYVWSQGQLQALWLALTDMRLEPVKWNPATFAEALRKEYEAAPQRYRDYCDQNRHSIAW